MKKKEEKFCQNCNCILDKRKIDIQKLDDKDNINNLISILFNEKEKFENEIDNLIKSFHKNDENNKKNNNVFDFCDECLIKKFIKGGIENLLKTNEANLEEIINNCNEFLSENKKIELNISQTLNELNNLIKNKNINEKDIIQIINKVKENDNKFKDNNIYLENFINEISKKENKFKENIEQKTEKKYENIGVSEGHQFSYISKNKPILSSPQKTYRIFTEKKIYESKYEKEKLNKTKIFLCNYLNQLNNCVINVPMSFKKNTYNMNLLTEEISKKNNLINSISDIKKFENNDKNKKGKINSMFMPLKYQSLEIEKKISKLKGNNINDYNTSNENNLNKDVSNNNNLNKDFPNDNNLNKDFSYNNNSNNNNLNNNNLNNDFSINKNNRNNNNNNNLNNNNYNSYRKNINFSLNNNLENNIINDKNLIPKLPSYELNNHINPGNTQNNDLSNDNNNFQKSITNEFLNPNNLNNNNNNTGIINNIQGQNNNQIGYNLINNNIDNSSFLNNPYQYINNINKNINTNTNGKDNFNFLNNIRLLYTPNIFKSNSLFANNYNNNPSLYLLDKINIARNNMRNNTLDNLHINNLYNLIHNSNPLNFNLNENNIINHSIPIYNDKNKEIKQNINKQQSSSEIGKNDRSNNN